MTTKTFSTTTQSPIKKIAAWISVIFGVLLCITTTSIAPFYAALLVGAGFAIPGAWWLWCEHKDKQAQNEFELASAEYAEATQYLDEEQDAWVFSGLGNGPQKPTKVNRRWGIVWTVAGICFFAGLVSTPAQPEPNQVATIPTESSQSSPATTTSATTESSATSEAPVTTTSATEITTTSDQQPAPNEYEQEARINNEQDNYYVPAPSPEPVQEPAPEPEPASVYYASCADARADLAAPLYAGQPGYGTHLDRDGDGVACEN